MPFEKDTSYAAGSEPPMGRMPTHPRMLYERVQMASLKAGWANEGDRKVLGFGAAVVFTALAGLSLVAGAKAPAIPLAANAAFALANGAQARRRQAKFAHHFSVISMRYDNHIDLGPSLARATPLWQELLRPRQVETVRQTHEQAYLAPQRQMWGLGAASLASTGIALAATGMPLPLPITIAAMGLASSVGTLKIPKFNHSQDGLKIIHDFNDRNEFEGGRMRQADHAYLRTVQRAQHLKTAAALRAIYTSSQLKK